MSSVFKLYRLQQLDSQLDRLRDRLRAIEEILNDEAELRKAQQKAERTEAVLKEAQRELRQAEEKTRAQRVKIEQTEATLYSGKVQNPKELQDLQNEAAALRRYLAVLEDRQLERMLAVDEVKKTFDNAASRLRELRAQREVEFVELKEEKTSLERDVERLLEERQATISTIDADDLRLYESTRGRRGGLAVAHVADKTCSACGSTLSAALLQEARSPHKITRCNFCGRILYAN